MDEFIDYVMNTIASKGFDREKLKNRLESDWIALDIKGSQLIKEINDILKDAGATDAQIKWGDDLPVLSLEKEKRINKLETDLNDLAVDVKVEHAAFVSCANTQLTALGENGGILKENANSEKR